MAFGCWLNIRKNGTTYQVPCYSAVEEASPMECPCFCVRYNNTTYYACVSASDTYAVAAFRYNSTTFYLVTQHAIEEICRWIELIQFTDAGTYTLPTAYQHLPIHVVIQSSNGEAGKSGRRHTATAQVGTSHSSYIAPKYTITSLGGAGGVGGTGHYVEQDSLDGFSAGYVFTCERRDGNSGYGTGGGAGGVGFEIQAITVANGGGGGGQGGTAGTIKIDNNGFDYVDYMIYVGETGYTGGDGKTSGSAGSNGTSVGWTKPRYHASYVTGGAGGAGGCGGNSSTVAYAVIQVGYVR